MDQNIPAGAIPADQFEAANAGHDQMPEGAIPADQFEAQQAEPQQDASSIGDTAKAGLEGVASSILPFGVSQGVEQLYGGAKPEDILKRQEEHPIAHGVGQVAGLFVPQGMLAKGMTAAGEAAQGIAGLSKATTWGAKVGSAVVQQAAEMAVLQGSDETAKMLMKDPNTSTESAMANIGLAAALGGGTGAFFTGAVSPLWNATIGSKLETGLKAEIASKGGIEGANDVTAQTIEQQTGIPMPDVLKAKANGQTFLGNMAEDAMTNDTIMGRKNLKVVDAYHDQLRDAAVHTLAGEGYKPVEENLYKSAEDVGSHVISDIKAERVNQDKIFGDINKDFEKTKFDIDNQRQMQDDLAKLVLDKGLNKGESDEAMKLVQKTMDNLGKKDSALDIKQAITNLRDAHPYGKETFNVAKDIRDIYGKALDRARITNIEAAGGSLEEVAAKKATYQEARQQYSGLMGRLEDLGTQLRLGNFEGPGGFQRAFEEKLGRDSKGLMKAMSGDTHVEALEALKAVSPKAYDAVRQFQINKVLSGAMKDGSLDIAKLSAKMKDMQPQMRDFIASPEQQMRLQGIADASKVATIHPSYTKKLGDSIVHQASTPLALMAAMLGHSGAAILTKLTDLGYKEGKDGLKLALVKLLSSKQPVSAEGFHSMVQLFNNAYKGQAMMNAAAQSLFGSKAAVVEARHMPNQDDRDKLQRAVDKIQSNPNQLVQNEGGAVGHYLNDHQQALSQATARQVQYLSTVKPQPFKPSALEKEIPPSKAQISRYNRALDIATNPMVVMQHLKDGTIVATDIQDLKGMYPALYNDMAQKVTNQMATVHAGDIEIPYTTKLGLTLFLGSPVDSTMAPQSIMSAQTALQRQAQKTQQEQQQQPQKSGAKRGTSTLGKSNNQYMTPDQASEADNTKRD